MSREYEDELRAMLDAAREQGREEGRRAGFAEGVEAAARHVDARADGYPHGGNVRPSLVLAATGIRILSPQPTPARTEPMPEVDERQSAEYRRGFISGWGERSAVVHVATLDAGTTRALFTEPTPTSGGETWTEAEVLDRARGLDTEKRVRFYEHDFYVLSNFSAFPIRWPTADFGGAYDDPFLTSEHAYHWEKFRFSSPEGNDIARRIRLGNLSAHEAFKLAEENKAHRRTDWDAVKVDVMRRILRAKTEQHEYVHRKLLATGDRELVEDSWRDDFWGWGPNRDGQNMLGKLWMELRAELRDAVRKRGGGA